MTIQGNAARLRPSPFLFNAEATSDLYTLSLYAPLPTGPDRGWSLRDFSRVSLPLRGVCFGGANGQNFRRGRLVRPDTLHYMLMLQPKNPHPAWLALTVPGA